MGELVPHEEHDALLNRQFRLLGLRAPSGSPDLEIPPLLDAQLVGLMRERMILLGIERHGGLLISKIENLAQTWVCGLDRD